MQVEQKDGEVIINLVGKAVTAITGRLTSLSSFDGTESKVGQLQDGPRLASLALDRVT